MLFKNSVRTSKRTPHFTITKINWLTLTFVKLDWAERVILLMDNNRTVKKIFNTKPIGIRKIGRPTLRWEDDVTQDIKTLGVKNWRKVAMEKESWQKLLMKAM
jgi:hypothetical protein